MQFLRFDALFLNINLFLGLIILHSLHMQRADGVEIN